MDTLIVLVIFSVLYTGSVLGTVEINGISDGSTFTQIVDGSPMFTCKNDDGSGVQWVVIDPMFGEILIADDPPYTINEATVSGVTTSFLTIEGVTTDDSGTFECRSASDSSDKVTFQLQVTDGSLPPDWVAPKIERDSESQTSVEVEVGAELRLKCVGGGEGSNLAFSRDGQVFKNDEDNAMLTSSSMMNVNTMVLIMSLEPVVAGSYMCQDLAYPDTQTDVIDVTVSQTPAVRVEIISESGPKRVFVREKFDVRCQAALGTDITWTVDGRAVVDGEDGYVIGESEDRMKMTLTSLLTKDEAQLSDGGVYTCENADNAAESDSLTVSVYEPGTEPDSEDGDDDDDDDDDSDSVGDFLDDIFGGTSGLSPQTLIVCVAAVLTIG